MLLAVMILLAQAAAPVPDPPEPTPGALQRFRLHGVLITVGEVTYRAPITPGTWYRVRRDLPFKVTLAVRASRAVNPCPADNPCTITVRFVLNIPSGREVFRQEHQLKKEVTKPGGTNAYTAGPFSIPGEIPAEYLGQALMTWTFADKDGVFFSFAMNFVFREVNSGE